MIRPATRYARSSDVHIAYEVVGEGPLDLVFVHGLISNLEQQWDDPGFAHLLSRLAAFSRLIIFDKRGASLSDRVPPDALPTLEQRMDDVRAVMDAAESRRAALFGSSEGGPIAMLFAATYPPRTRARHIPPAVRVPTLVLHRKDDVNVLTKLHLPTRAAAAALAARIGIS